MALVSGRPISFQMDLYTPLYVPRPTVVPELFTSLRPVAYNGDLGDDLRLHAGLAKLRELKDVVSNEERVMSKTTTGKNKAGAVTFDRQQQADTTHFALGLQQELSGKMNLGEGVTPAATATKRGDFF